MIPTQDDANLTELLARLSSGDLKVEGDVMRLVYNDLRRLAQHYLRAERPDHTLQATALVHEVYLRLSGEKGLNWQNRAHFFAVASRAMRRVLVDHARNAKAVKRAGVKISLDSALVCTPEQSSQLVELDEALARLAAADPRPAQVVEMRFFGGLSNQEIAFVLNTSERTVKRDWNFARAWLYGELTRLVGA